MNAKLEERFRPEAMLNVIEDLVTRWHRHHRDYAEITIAGMTERKLGQHLGAMHAYCKAISLMTDQSYSAVEDALRRGPGRGGL